jgi:glycosyltransferase involved in cell wall biosynthesis
MRLEKIRIALIAKNQIYAGGASAYESSIIKCLRSNASKHIEFEIFQPLGSDPHEDFGLSYKYKNSFVSKLASFFRSTRIGRGTASFSDLFKGRLERTLIEHKIDIAYFLSPNPQSLGLIEIPMINTVWDLGHRDLPEYKEMASRTRFAKREFYYSRVLPNSFLVVTDSKKTSDRINNVYGVLSDLTIDAGLFPAIQDSPIDIEKSDIFSKEDYLIYPAQFWSHKNHELLVDLMLQIKEEFPDVNLYLTGSDKGEMSRICELVRTAKLEECIRILGFVESDFLTKLIKGARALVFPSRLGPTNLPPLEALMLGTPVVVTKTNSTLIHNPKHGVWVVEDNSVSHFTDAVLEILRNPIRIHPVSFDKQNNEAATEILQMISAKFNQPID